MAALHHSSLTLFIVQAIVIIAASRLVGLIARRIGQPMVVAEVVAGILLGPSLLGWLAPDFYHGLFPTTSLPLLNIFSQVGLVFFMFLIGLELDPRLMQGRGRASLFIAYSSILVPFLLGAGLAVPLYPGLAQQGAAFSSFALFMGTAMSITAFPVLARILAERQLLRSKVGVMTITCAAVNDVMAWCILAFVVSIVRLSGAMEGVRTTILSSIYIAFMLLVLKPFLARMGARATNREGLSQNVVAVIFLMLFASSWATELIGIHALFGAFMLGVIIPKEDGFSVTLGEKLEDFVVVFLLPLFFAYTGLRTEIGLLNSPDLWAMCGFITLIACLGKFLGSAVPARFVGLSWRESGALGILMNTRGLMELIVLNIGLDLGVISPALFAMLVIMAVATTFMTTPLLQWVYPPAELAKALVEPPEPAATAPVEDAFTVLMCVSYDRSGPGMVQLAGALSDPQHSRYYALRLIRPTERTSFYLKGDPDPGATALKPLMDRARELEVPVRPLSFVSSDPGHDICNVAEVKGADLVLLGWHKPLFSQTVLGGTVYDVMRQARTDVAVLIDRGLTTLRRVLVPYYGSPHDRAALELAHRLSKRIDASVTLLHVIEPERAKNDPRLDVQGRMDEVFQEPDDQHQVRLKVVPHEDPAEAALEEAVQGYDLVLVGVGHEWGLEERQFGIRPETLIQKCPTSLLVVRRYEEPRGEGAVDETGASAGVLAG